MNLTEEEGRKMREGRERWRRIIVVAPSTHTPMILMMLY